MAEYLELLEESLKKKIEVLNRIEEFNLKQREVFKTVDEMPDFDKFDSYIEEKDKLIEELNVLDNGFETLYERVADTLKTEKSSHADTIKRLQDLIREITDKSSTIQSQEKANKEMMEDFFKNARDRIGRERNSLNAAYAYFQQQQGMNGADSIYMDSKQQ